MIKFASVTNVSNEEDLIGGFLDLMDVFVKIIIISDKTYKGNYLVPDNSEKIALSKDAIVIRVNTDNQILMRNIGLSLAQGMGCEYAFITDVDEWYSTEVLNNYKKFIEENPCESYRAVMQCVFRKPNWGVTSPHDGGSCVAMRTDQRMQFIRSHSPAMIIPKELGQVIHLSYARTPEKMAEKIKNFSHAHEVIGTWYDNVFLPCTLESRNVHPTTPEAWPEIKMLELPEEIKSKIPEKLWK